MTESTAFGNRIVCDPVTVNPSSEVMSDLAVGNLCIENHGVEPFFLWATPAGLTAKA